MKVLERTFRKSERIVAKAKFTYMVFLREVLIAAILGGIIAVLWIFTPQINELLKQKILTQSILKWAVVGAGAFVVVLGIFEAIAKWHKEAVITDRKFVVRTGIFRLVDIQLPLNKIFSKEFWDMATCIFQLIQAIPSSSRASYPLQDLLNASPVKRADMNTKAETSHLDLSWQPQSKTKHTKHKIKHK